MNQIFEPGNLLDVVSGVPGISWPAIPNLRASQLLALQFQLEQSQWLPPEEIERRQIRQLGILLNHAYQAVPFYRERLEGAGLIPGRIKGPGDWRKIPLLKRVDIQSAGKSLLATKAPKEHGAPGYSTTSGSSGAPVTVVGTAVTRLFWNAFILRQHLWHRRNFTLKLATIRHFDEPHSNEVQIVTDNWGSGTVGIVATGPAVSLNIREPVAEQADWLERQNPGYLLSYPSNLFALARHFTESGRQLTKLREVRSFGEILEPHVRVACREAWGVPVTDAYSSQEVGYMAMQCPQHEYYHVQSEGVLIEVLDEHGNPCQPGEIGRVVVTSLHNFRMPLLRYDIGDFAEVGESCDCGRGLPVLKRIVGRQRNMFRLPSGEQFWPTFDFGGTPKDLPPIRQFQVVQRSQEEVEAILVVFRPLSDDEEQRIKSLLTRSLRHPFQIKLTYTDNIPPGPTGKYEDFRSDVP